MAQRASPSPSNTMRVKRMESSLGFHSFNRAKSWDSTLKLWREYMLILTSHPLTYISFILLYTFLQNVAWHFYALTMGKHWLGKIPKTSNTHIHQYIKRVRYFLWRRNFCLFLSNSFIHLYEWYINLLSWRAITIIVHPVLDYGITHSVHGSPDSTKGLSH